MYISLRCIWMSFRPCHKILQIRDRREIKRVVPNGKVSALGDTCSEFETHSTYTWGLARIAGCLLQNPCMYRYEPEMDVDIYIVDTGILTEHEEFKPGRATCEFVSSDAGDVCKDDHNHGTHVAGIAGGNVHGVAKKAKLIGVKVLASNGGGSTAGVISGLDWIGKKVTSTRRPSVINMSLGGSAQGALDDAVTALLDVGIPAVLAAGNDDYGNACLFSPGRVGGEGGNAITVMASDVNDKFAWFSNCGPCADIIAPGVEIRLL